LPFRGWWREATLLSLIIGQFQQTVQAQQEQVRETAVALQQTQHRLSELEQALQAQLAETAACSHLLHQQRTQLQQQMTTTAASHDRLRQVRVFLSQQGQKSFQSTLTAGQTISDRTDCIKRISTSLTREVETIYTAAGMVKQICKQARFLGLRAAVLASRFGTEAEGFGQVTADFGQLSQQALKTGHQLEATVEQLRGRNAELVHLAQTGDRVAKTLTHQASDVETGLAALDRLLTAPPHSARTTAAL
jgi:methyl-accepting chemotaxis protein